MFKNALLTFSELALWIVIAVIATSGCGVQTTTTIPNPDATQSSDLSSDPSSDDSSTKIAKVPELNEPRSNPTDGETTTVTTTEETKVEAMPEQTTSDNNAAKTVLADVPLIPRDVLFGNPERAQARLSPDGKWLSFLAPVKQEGDPNGEGVMNVWVAPVDDLASAEPVTDDTFRGIRSHNWAYNSEQILYSQDKGGDEDFHVYATNVKDKTTIDLTPIEKVHARLAGVSEMFPDEVLVALNDRIPQLHDLYRVNLKTGERELLQENPGLAAIIPDDNYKVRMAFNYTPDGGAAWLVPKGEPGEKGYEEFEVAETFGPEDAMTSSPVGFNKKGDVLYYEDSRDRNTAALFARNLAEGDSKLLAENDKADVGGILVHPTDHTIQAVSFTFARREWDVLDEAIQGDVDFLTDFADGEFEVTGRTLDDRYWTVAYILDDGPVKYYIYDRQAEGDGRMRYLFSNRDDLDDYPLVKMHAPVIKSRDGLDLVSYLTLPPGSDPDGDGVPNQPVPMILDVHGGPWARDDWGYNPYHQWLANRGYAVLNVNYRGSTGFGKDFINAANAQWSRKMHDDLLDAVKWAVDNKIAIEDKICIMGGSYGGYATLVGLTYTPDTFACGVDIVGPSSLVTLLENVPDYWIPFMPVMKIRVGDVSTEEGRADLLAMSPLTHVDRIERPLLIGQGANDPRVTQLEADQIVEAMTEKNIPVTYVLYPDEGHGFARPQNRTSFNAVTEAFLAKQLGGRFQKIGDDFEGSSIHVPTGAADVPGLKDSLTEEQMKMPPEPEKEEEPAEPAGEKA
ncbi:prolyl oligopeptidase family serine peptidase [Aeoliella sp.]|uniref:S9 family peptidase n=1 Tax=Aeoliella sp. TaxID=2795800 RepID=UPI003CCBB199